MLGRSVLIEEVPQSMVDSALSGMGDETSSRSTSQEETHAIERQLIALCQTAVDAGSSDVHVMVERDKTHFLLRTNGLRRVIERFHNAQSALNQPREVGVTLINYVFSTLGSQDVKLSRPANDRFSVVLKVEGQSREFEWRAALIPTHDGAKLTLRCLTPKNKALRLEDMDLPAPYLSTLTTMMRKRQGAIVITGPMAQAKARWSTHCWRKLTASQEVCTRLKIPLSSPKLCE
ncbi:general secretion pathway protein E [Vibrio astriarenae]|nr:general secretion pathway protein E [Vibrio sp. C7]